MNHFTDKPPQLTAEERAADNSAYAMYLESYFGHKHWATEAEADERDWVERHHGKLYKAFQGDKLKEFWQTLAENFFMEYGPSHEGTRRGLSIHQYLVETLFDYIEDEHKWISKGVSVEEIRTKSVYIFNEL
ncbi:hypothetical protein C8J56DRAFT_1062716 [Mycena floridula]|nr:hypothetical protein C8J56DRAFT_1062716 [Mycena floridula]